MSADPFLKDAGASRLGQGAGIGRVAREFRDEDVRFVGLLRARLRV